jgi:hypothetical protein
LVATLGSILRQLHRGGAPAALAALGVVAASVSDARAQAAPGDAPSGAPGAAQPARPSPTVTTRVTTTVTPPRAVDERGAEDEATPRAVASGVPRASADGEPAWQRAPAIRRSGFMLGITVGPSVGMAAGYPNDAKKLGREAFYTETGVGFGGGLSLVLGGALSDWLVFGVGLTASSFAEGDVTSAVGAFTFRTEVFPLWALGGKWRELGLGLDAGTGGASIVVTDDPDTKLADAGSASRVGAFAFYEGIRLWKISMGPYLGGNYAWSSTLRHGEIGAGWRTVLYAGAISPPPKPARASSPGPTSVRRW